MRLMDLNLFSILSQKAELFYIFLASKNNSDQDEIASYR